MYITYYVLCVVHIYIYCIRHGERCGAAAWWW